MRYLSVCSGIEAATVAWHPLGWTPAAFAEIEPFPSAVLAHHYPNVPNLGDMTKFKEWPDYGIDALVGGTPCQSYSIGGLRKGLADPRGNLMLTFGAIAAKYRARRLVWENVPGVLSSDGGRDFARFLGLITGQHVSVPVGGWGGAGIVPGYRNAYGAAYRVLDAQYFGVPQQRRRVFVVGCLGDWRRAAAVLFERESFEGRIEARPAPVVSVCITRRGPGSLDDRETYVVEGVHPRHMTPREIERAFGFEDDYTLVPYRGRPAADGPRYSALGNSMAPPVMSWIGERIQMVDEIDLVSAA